MQTFLPPFGANFELLSKSKIIGVYSVTVLSFSPTFLTFSYFSSIFTLAFNSVNEDVIFFAVYLLHIIQCKKAASSKPSFPLHWHLCLCRFVCAVKWFESGRLVLLGWFCFRFGLRSCDFVGVLVIVFAHWMMVDCDKFFETAGQAVLACSSRNVNRVVVVL